jgi:alkyldihydroxyacetonephosphate synthase
VHQSHAYPDGACLYFTFAGRDPAAGTPEAADPMAWAETYYRTAWDVASAATLRAGAALSHHHGIGLNRGRFLADALDGGFSVLAGLKAALDPAGVLNPGKLGLPSPFGPPPWP